MIHDAIGPWSAIRRHTAVFVVGFLAMMACENSEDAMGPENNGPLPVAAAGADLTVSANVAVQLDGSASTDPDGGALTYEWSFAARPAGSAAALDDATSERPNFVPDLPGEYRFELVVTSAGGDSQPDDVTVTAEDNTATATVGAAGGDVASKDGNFTLSFPAGALAQDAEIGLTLVLPDQYPAALASLLGDAGLYAVTTGGAEVTGTATVSVRLPDAIENEAGQLQASAWVLARLVEAESQPSASQAVDASVFGAVGYSGDPLEDQRMRALGADPNWYAEAQVLGEWLSPNPFLLWYARVVVDGGDEDVTIDFALDIPSEAQTLDTTSASTTLVSGTPATWQTLAAEGDVVFQQEDVSTGIQWVTDPFYNENFGPIDGGGFGVLNYFTSSTPGMHEVGSDVVIDIEGGAIESLINELFSLVVQFRRDIEFKQPLGPFTTIVGLTGIEGGSRLPNGGLTFSYSEGALNASNTGEEIGRAIIQSDSDVTPWIAIGVGDKLFLNSTDAGYIAPTVSGFQYAVPWSAPGNVGNGTDALSISASYQFGSGAAAHSNSLTASQQAPHDAVFVMYDERNLLFAKVEGDDVILDPELADAFVSDGQSVFGTARPVSAYVSPNGFTPSDPMLVVTIPDDQSSDGQLLKLDLVDGKAVPTVVSDVFVTGLPRRVRCIQAGSYICAVSSVGIPPFGFGSITFFTWDGQDGFSFIIQRLNPAIGIDLILDGDRVLVASAVGSEYYIDELTASGAYVNFQSFPVPEGCTGAAHVLFRTTRDVVISCNTSGSAVGAVFDDGS